MPRWSWRLVEWGQCLWLQRSPRNASLPPGSPGSGVHFSFSRPFLPPPPWRDADPPLSLAGPSLAAHSSPRLLASLHCPPRCSLASPSSGWGGSKHWDRNPFSYSSVTPSTSSPCALLPQPHCKQCFLRGSSLCGQCSGLRLDSCSGSPPSSPLCVGAVSDCTPATNSSPPPLPASPRPCPPLSSI